MSRGDPSFIFPLGEAWYQECYPRIRTEFGFSSEADARSRNLLSSMLLERQGLDIWLKTRSESVKTVVVFGAGPSLDEDIVGLDDFLRDPKPLIIAADGAADALAETGHSAEIIVSDLDSCSENLLMTQSNKRWLFAHAHGDNIDLIEKIVPKLGQNVIGTTQVRPLENVHNIGGFTDGDRSCYLAASYRPSVIILVGMDFGPAEGKHSKNRYSSNPSDSSRRKRKLELGLKSLEFLIRNCPNIEFVNATRSGASINGATKVSYSEIIARFS